MVNPSASSVTARTRVVIAKALAADHEVSVVSTVRRGHATRLARNAAGDGTDAVVVLAGDGTLNEAANGLVGTRCALAPLPGGSTNVLARSLGYPDDPIEATGMLLDALARRSWHRVGLGEVNGRVFLFHLGVGFDAAVVARVERRSEWKRWASHLAFLGAVVATWARRDEHRPRFAVHHADGSLVDDAFFAVVQNADPYTYLGSRPISLAREADFGTGLAVVSVRPLSAVHLARLAASALGNGRLLARDRRAPRRFGVQAVRFEGYGPFPYQLDGDYLGDVESLEVLWRPDALDLVVPAG